MNRILGLSAFLIASLLSLLGVLLLLSPGKPDPIVDDDGRPLRGSISQKIHSNINGVEQGMFITSKSENLAYDYMLKQYKENGNREMVRKLEAAPPSMTVPLPAAYDSLRDEAMHGLVIGTTHEMKSVITGVFIPSWLSRDYTVSEKVNYWRGKFFSKRILWDKLMATDLTAQVTELNLPVYFLHGKYDYTDSFTLARDYFDKLKAPLKGFYTFEQSAHSPMFEEPERTQKILREDVLLGVNKLADK